MWEIGVRKLAFWMPMVRIMGNYLTYASMAANDFLSRSVDTRMLLARSVLERQVPKVSEVRQKSNRNHRVLPNNHFTGVFHSTAYPPKLMSRK